MRSRTWPPIVLLAPLLISSLASAEPASAPQRERKPVIAVFDIATRNVSFPKTSLEALTTFLSARIAATGLYRVSPQEVVRKRLKAQKKESYKLCYDRSCQIAIGRELAADRSLATEIAKVGTSCLLSIKLYDLKDEVTEFAHAEPLACQESALGAALVRGVVALQRWREKALRSKKDVSSSTSNSAPTMPTGPRVSVYLRSEPSAEVLVDDLRRGHTPLTLTLNPQKRYRLSLLREGYETHHVEISPGKTRQLEVAMTPTKEGRFELAAASEWFAMEFGPALVKGSSKLLFGLSLSFSRIKWTRLFWVPVELNMALAPASTDADNTEKNNASLLMIGTRFGYPWYLGTRGQHQLLFGLGAGFLGFDDGAKSATESNSTLTSYFGLSPSVSYLYNAFDGIVPFGISLRGMFPLAGSPEAGEDRPLGAMLTVSFGFSFWRLIKGTNAWAAAQPATETP
ncbi:MAG: PEGA domain-containing protein [Deltaproteobacteria bacterium]|nr:PEGA domain-containing protein [Deltaproteobacteria bacterium]